ncbi:raffinose/stachyose/melibiose transport system substrate-binding protein [Solirubrobacter pauli]|uniref:Raffinose/stachyose/melibiose transport system substrate-binding protein n=1 Tax=Solirubrobacter pauli TaxID=166793 RepID=A0A660L027_9ACTN|nr:extracellular solute-binding protein [Solirubrobacter pauli]RKQ87216.1 raffinose/stachyose/melibiose transport system substrate-binding protein [Solirubrobacter pauli]
MTRPIRSALVLAAAAASLAACGGGDDDPAGSAAKKSDGGPVTIEWWHIQNNPPMKGIWADAVQAYQADHPNVKINVTVLENEAFKAKLTTTMQSGKVPDIFQSWGGGTLKEQADAGLVQDVTEPTKAWIGELNPAATGLYELDGKQYGIPFNLGMVGVWYRKSLFEKAGIETPPATWDEFLTTVQTLKAKGITPLAIGEKDKWPGMFWWANLSLRIAGKDALAQAGEDGSFDGPGFVKAGDELQRLIDLQPFQKGFLAAPWDGAGGEAAQIGTGKAAMSLMGQWAPSTYAANAKDADAVLGDLGWFPFPTVDGGAGGPTEQFGGGDGFAFGKDAPPEAVDFAKFLVTSDVANKAGASGGILPVKKGTESSVTDVNMKSVLDARAKADFVQLYLDQAYAPAVGQAVNDAVQELFAGKASPQDVAGTIADAAKAG